MSQGSDAFVVDEIVERLGRSRDRLLGILHALQRRCGYLPEAELRRLCEIADVTPAAVEGVCSFYAGFRRRPVGEHIIRVCVGTACHVKGAPLVHEAFCEHLHVPDGDDTDPQRRFTVEKVACLGCCTLAPAVQIGDVVYGHLSRQTVPTVLADYLALQARRAERASEGAAAGTAAGAGEIRVSMDTCCLARGSQEVYDALDAAVRGSGAAAVVKAVGCAGMSYLEPLVEVSAPGRGQTLYRRVQPGDAAAIVRRHFPPRGLGRVRAAVAGWLDRVLTDEAAEPVTRYAVDVRDPDLAAFRGPQVRIATEHAAQTRPTDLDEYRAAGGFAALAAARARRPEDVIADVEASGLRGRGGAGYPTGRKWRAVREASGGPKHVVCNGDEGDPGAFMDRMLLESQPYRVLEGLAIAAWAVGASRAHVYVRAEYPLAVRRLREAIERCGAAGLLRAAGDDGVERAVGRHGAAACELPVVEVVEGAGAFVCGEETALLASLEGRRPMPRPRPPYPSQAGLGGAPTLVNNTETLAVVPWILRNGPAAWAALGTRQSRGTKVFALAGKVARGGLIEVPMGTTIRQIVEEIGGGAGGGRAFKAVQIGGPSGGCVPAELADTPVDYEALTAAGAMMGSGGLVVLDETDCMVEIARYFLEFTQRESCGRCTFCRVGTRVMLDILTRLTEGQADAADVARLEELAEQVRAGSLCGLGRTAPNPVLSTLRYFHDEYEAHLAGRCPAKQCRALITYTITEDCIGCTRCAQRCPADAIAPRPHERHEIDPDACIRCGTCAEVCPVDAVRCE